MRRSGIYLGVLLLAGCTFGVPIGKKHSDAEILPSGKSKYGNPRSYVVFGKRYYVMDSSQGFVQRGVASWYGPNFHGKRTSSGETYNMHGLTAAHKTLPLPTWVRVRNLSNGKTAVVKVNDRGPFAHDRILDLSFAAAKKLDVVGPGTAEVEIIALDASGKASARPTVRAVPLQQHNKNADEIYIQLGSFGSEDNANNLLTELQTKNEKPLLISQLQTGKGIFYRVRLGPLLDVNEAVSVQKRLQRKGYEQTRIVVGEE